MVTWKVFITIFISGESFASLHFTYRMGKSTVGQIVYDTCQAIAAVLQPDYLKVTIINSVIVTLYIVYFAGMEHTHTQYVLQNYCTPLLVLHSHGWKMVSLPIQHSI